MNIKIPEKRDSGKAMAPNAVEIWECTMRVRSTVATVDLSMAEQICAVHSNTMNVHKYVAMELSMRKWAELLLVAINMHTICQLKFAVTEGP